MANSKSIKKYRGLVVQPNSITAPDGSFEESKNASFIYDDIISKRRGFTEGHYFASEDINDMFDYSDYMFAVGNTTLFKITVDPISCTISSLIASTTLTVTTSTDHGLTTGDYINGFTSASGQTLPSLFTNGLADYYGRQQITVTGPTTFTVQAQTAATANSAGQVGQFYAYTRMTGPSFTVTPSGIKAAHGIAANKCYYFTTDNGFMKVERTDLPYLKAGIPQGLDVSGVLGPTSAGVFDGPSTPGYQRAYRIVFGRRDAQKNLILGAPSATFTIANTASVASTAAAHTPTVVTITVAGGHGLGSTGTAIIKCLTFTGTATTDPVGSLLTATVTSSTQFTFSNVPFNITALSAFTFAPYATARLYFSVPSEIASTEYVYQVYRTAEYLNSVSVTPIFKLVTEKNLTSTEATNKYVSYFDELPQVLVDSAAELYTDEDTQEGEAQANSRPPYAMDVASFKGYTFYANVASFQYKSLSLIATSTLVNSDEVVIDGITYIFRGNGATNSYMGNEITNFTSGVTQTLGVARVTTTADHGFVVGDVIKVLSVSNVAGMTATTYTITAATATTFDFGTGISTPTAPYYVTISGLRTAANKYFVKLYQQSSTGTLVTTTQAIDSTARLLVQAINASTANIYAQYTSGIGDAPGKMFLTSKDLSDTTWYLTANTAVAGSSFFPALPAAGTTVSSEQDVTPNGMYLSKKGLPEAVPLVNQFNVGEAGEILRILPLTDSFIILKNDGVYRLNGDNINNFVIVPLDTTVFCKASDSCVALNNSVYALTNQGVVRVTDSSIQVISRSIEPLLTSVLQNPLLESITSAYSYESDRHYVLSTIKPNSTSSVPDVTYIYNYLTDTWTTSDAFASAGIIEPTSDSAWYVTTDFTSIYKERKQQSKIDYTGQEFPFQCWVGNMGIGSTILGTATVSVVTQLPHGLKVGDLVTVHAASPNIYAVYGTGSAAVVNLASVASVTDTKNFTVTLAPGDLALSNISDWFQFTKYICEYDVGCSITVGQTTATLSFALPHGLVDGQSVTVNSAATALIAGLASVNDILGYRAVTVTSATQVTIQLTNAATGNVSSSCNVTDSRVTKEIISINTAGTFTPQLGDAIVVGSTIYKTVALEYIMADRYVAQLNYSAAFSSTANTFLHGFYETKLKTNPIAFGSPDEIKQFSQFQVDFRAGGNASRMNVDFANDSCITSGVVTWNDRVGSDKSKQIVFAGWGELFWGDDPWAEGESTARTFTSRPSVILRTYVPKKAFLGTYIQPTLTHRVAGEEINIQSINFEVNNVSTKVSR